MTLHKAAINKAVLMITNILIFVKAKIWLFVVLYIAISLWISIAPLRHESISFLSDIARDYLILDQIDKGDLTLIGPRTSTMPGLFHGPLWAYLNYPAFKVSNGNPLTIGWFWVSVTVLTQLFVFYRLRKTFNMRLAAIFLLLSTMYLVPEMTAMYNPHGALLLLPLLLERLYVYLHKRKLMDAIWIVLILGLLIQFQIAVGLPLAFLTVPLMTYSMLKNKNLSHSVACLAILIPLSTFIAFDLRNDFVQLKSFLSHATGTVPDMNHTPWVNRINQRLYLLATGGMGIFNQSVDGLNVLIFAVFSINLYSLFRRKVTSNVDQLFLLSMYLYVGFLIISIFFNGDLLYHHRFPIYAASALGFAAIVSKSTKTYLQRLALLIVLSLGLLGDIRWMNKALLTVGTHESDWKLQKSMAETIMNDNEPTFGYFVYSPDIFGYQSKAAMVYLERHMPEANISRLSKEPVTYLIVAPPAPDQEYLNSTHWLAATMQLKRLPDRTWDFPYGYQVQKYYLQQEEMQNPSDSDRDWMTFR